MEKGARIEIGDLPNRFAFFTGALQHLVFALVGIPGEVTHIGHIHDVADLKTEVFQRLSEDILEDVGAKVTDMGEVVDGGTTTVESDLSLFYGNECLQLPAHRVPEFHLHETPSSCGSM